MKLESQVVSLELAKKLKELGVPQESLFWWVRLNEEWCVSPNFSSDPNWKEKKENYSAFTVAELGEMLPVDYFTFQNEKGDWFVARIDDREISELGTEIIKTEDLFQENTEADARAKCLIYLIENKLLNAKISI